MTKEEQVRFLEKYFSSVYCDTCRHGDDGACYDCHRKDMNWGLSHEVAEEVVNKLTGGTDGA